MPLEAGLAALRRESGVIAEDLRSRDPVGGRRDVDGKMDRFRTDVPRRFGRRVVSKPAVTPRPLGTAGE